MFRLFKQLLEVLEEDISGLPFIDILHKMEKLKEYSLKRLAEGLDAI
jgi:hypothetical protein